MKYEQINLEDYFQSGEGGQAVTYTRKDGRAMAKLFLKSIGVDTVEREFRISQAVYKAGIPSPQPIRLVTDGERFGAEYEVIVGKRSFTRIISEEPEQLEPLTERFAELARQLHNTPADTKRLPAMKDLVRDQILRYEGLPADVRDKALQYLDTLPDTTTCLHGDLHIGNIITNGERTLWIDVGDFAYGAPEWDLCMLFYSANFINEQRADNIFHLTPDVLKKHWVLFAKAYYGITTEEEIKVKEQTLYPFFALKLLFVIGKLHNGLGVPSDAIIGLVRKYLGM